MWQQSAPLEMAIYCGPMYIAHKGAGGRENCPRRAHKAKTSRLLGKTPKVQDQQE